MRYEVLTNACAEAGILHLLLGHHAADQAETLAMRVLRGSQTHGLAGMAALRETAAVCACCGRCWAFEPPRCGSFLTARGVGWVEDPSNHDLRALRPRLRRALASALGGGRGLARLRYRPSAQLRRGRRRRSPPNWPQRAAIRPEGFALLSPGRISVARAAFADPDDRGRALSAGPAQISRPGGATEAGDGGGRAYLCRPAAGRWHADGARGSRDRRPPFRHVTGRDLGWALSSGRPRELPDRRHRSASWAMTQLGFRGCSDLPSAILRTLPALRVGEVLASVPHLGYACQDNMTGG